MSLFFATLAMLSLVVLLVAVVILVGSRFSPSLAGVRRNISESLYGKELPFAFLVAATATLGSLYLSEIAHLEPCKWCWIQRILMYPQSIIFGIAAWRKDRKVWWYTLPLATIGILASTYHRIIEEFPSLAGDSCNPMVPCTTKLIEEYGFITIPTMAFAAFGLIIVLMVVMRDNDRHIELEAELAGTEEPV